MIAKFMINLEVIIFLHYSRKILHVWQMCTDCEQYVAVYDATFEYTVLSNKKFADV